MILLKGSARVSAQPVDCYTAPLKLVPFGSEAFTYKRALTPFPMIRSDVWVTRLPEAR